MAFFKLCMRVSLVLAALVHALPSDSVDVPFQLVRPDETHTRLVVNEENLELLEAISDDVAAVAVVGRFHTGKSFLLNQMQGRTSGFALGPTVNPTTEGIWMWGKPMEVTKDGKQVAIVLLDTEGFSASNVSEVYDAKIFAVSTLLSSLLVYNDVRIIDQASIDYLEVLARRTRLFGVKAALDHMSVDDALVRFPPLLWVVEDFFQDLEGRSPTNWLHSLLYAARKDDAAGPGSGGGNLTTIFPSIECRTLFLPATTAEDLQRLDALKPGDLTPQYIREMKALRDTIVSRLTAKRFGGRTLNGAGLASLLRMLVTAANEGALPQLPSTWHLFVEQQRGLISEDGRRYYEKCMNPHILALPLPGAQLQAAHVSAQERVERLVEALVVGLEEVQADIRDSIRETSEALFEKTVLRNEQMLRDRCVREREDAAEAFRKALDAIDLPMPQARLDELVAAAASEARTALVNKLAAFDQEREYGVATRLLRDEDLPRIAALVELENRRAVEAVLTSAVAEAKKSFSASVASLASGVGDAELSAALRKAEDAGMEAYEAKAIRLKEENSYPVFKGHAKSALRELEDGVRDRNTQALRRRCDEVSKKVCLAAERELAVVPTPIDEEELSAKCGSVLAASMEQYRELLADISETGAFSEGERKMRSKLNVIRKTKEDENIEALKTYFKDAFEVARDVVAPQAKDFWFAYSFRSLARDEAQKRLDRHRATGTAIKLSKQYQERMIESWIERDLAMYMDSLNSQTEWLTSLAVAFIVIAVSGGAYAYCRRARPAPTPARTPAHYNANTPNTNARPTQGNAQSPYVPPRAHPGPDGAPPPYPGQCLVRVEGHAIRAGRTIPVPPGQTLLQFKREHERLLFGERPPDAWHLYVRAEAVGREGPELFIDENLWVVVKRHAAITPPTITLTVVIPKSAGRSWS